VKISVTHIVRGHFGTLRNAATGRISLSDLFIFLATPIVLAFLLQYSSLKISKDFYNLSITFFGIFIALLLNIQVAVFGVFQRNWIKSDDHILSSIQLEKLGQRRKLLSELNTNVSYLVVLSCICLIIYIGLFSFEADNPVSRFVTIVLYVHFTLTLLMVVKRTHALFQGEYDMG
jgi:hypothetical protein